MTALLMRFIPYQHSVSIHRKSNTKSKAWTTMVMDVMAELIDRLAWNTFGILIASESPSSLASMPCGPLRNAWGVYCGVRQIGV